MKIFIIGTGKMGAWLVEELCHDHEVAIFDKDIRRMKYFFNVTRFTELSQLKEFKPELLINTVSLQKTLPVFDSLLNFTSPECILADITSVKTGIQEYYAKVGRRFVSTHPMFGPTFSNIRDLRNESAIIINESCDEGKQFFEKFYQSLNLKLFHYSFKEHDEVMAYSLGTPFASSLVFAACLKAQEAPGTTYKKILSVSQGLLSEDEHLLAEILFNPETLKQIEKINQKLHYLTHIIKGGDFDEFKKFLQTLRINLEMEKKG